MYFGTAVASETNVMSSEEVFFLAKELEKDGDYQRAATEYKRYIVFAKRHPEQENPYKEEAYFQHAVSLEKAGEFDLSLKAYEKFGEHFPKSVRISEGIIKVGGIYEQAGDLKNAKIRYEQMISYSPESSHADTARLRLSFIHLSNNAQPEAVEMLKNVKTNQAKEKSKNILNTISEIEKLKLKRPAMAGTLSALLPGAGHLYVERPRDAGFAFLSNVLLIAGIFEAFDEGHDVLGGVLAFLETGWYTGTIFSAVSLTHKYNQSLKGKYLQQIQPFVSFKDNESAAGLAMRWQF